MSKKLNYDELYKQYRKLVYCVVLQYSSEGFNQVDDMVQDTFVELYERIDTMIDTNLASWLITTAKNKTLNEMKHLKKFEVEGSVHNSDQTLSEYPDVELIYLNKEAQEEKVYLCNEIFDVMYQKSPRWHMAMTECYRMNIPRNLVANHMGISVMVLDSILHRAREWVKKEFGITFKETRLN